MSEQHFEPVNTQVRFPDVEKEILDFWKNEKVFYKSLDATKDKKPFVFYDGPPFATGLPHYGHLLAGTLKDIVPRYWTMRGHYVERRFGWDCHGLPVENEMEKAFKVSGKEQIEELGTDLFNEACRSIVLRYTSQWQTVVERMGRWVDFNHQYRTMDATFMESIWWVFKQIWDKDLIYQGFRVLPYCPRCSTTLSNNELNEGYKDVKGPSITVTFPLANDPAVKILVWTTTPWTLPSNVVLAVGADIDYLKIKDGDDFFIIAKERVSAYYKNETDYEIVEELKGSDLEGLRYEPIFDYLKDAHESYFQVTTADYVSTENGTGVVHIAPAFGEDDYLVGQKLELPIFCPVDAEGKFTEEVPEYQGRVVYDADDDIIIALKNKKRLVHKTKIEHRYPHCYRCDTALIYKAMDTWFMSVQPLKENMAENNSRIHWVPDHLQKGRFGKGLESAPDWNISRSRYWGTPLPIWICEDCGEKECVGSLDEMHGLFGNGDQAAGKKIHADAVNSVKSNIENTAKQRFEDFNKGKAEEAQADISWAETVSNTVMTESDIHSHVINSVPVSCPKCKGTMKRTPEVLDCWFESGSMPYAQKHYPFENKKEFEESFPADFIAEGIDQTRGWFYSLTVLASGLFQKEAFKNVVVNGIILAEDGKKLSKRLKNYTDPTVLLDQLGADSLRLFLINSPAVKAEDLRFSDTGVRDMARAVLIPFWNAYSFLVTYANVDNWKPDYDDKPSSENELDRWIISLLNHAIESVNKEMEDYKLYKVVDVLVDFIDNLTNWYIRRSRRRFWKSENDNDKYNAYGTLHYVLVQFSKVMAPFLPFLTESIYRNLVVKVDSNAPESVHLCDFPMPDESSIDLDLESQMSLVRQIVGVGRVLRSRYNIKNRQPLSSLTAIVRDDKKRELLKSVDALIKEEINVKEVIFEKDESAVVDLTAKPNFRKLGKVFGKQMKDAVAVLSKLTVDQINEMENGGTIEVLGHTLGFDDIELSRTKREGIEVETDGEVTVALNTEITEELQNEGHAREFINRVQNIRKENDFNVTDKILISCVKNDQLEKALASYVEYICTETLGTEIVWSDTVDNTEEVSINGIALHLSVKRA